MQTALYRDLLNKLQPPNSCCSEVDVVLDFVINVAGRGDD